MSHAYSEYSRETASVHATGTTTAENPPRPRRSALLAQVRSLAIDSGIRRCAVVFKQHGIGLVSRATAAQLAGALADLENGRDNAA